MNEVPTADGGPGFLAFVAFFVLALALWFLMRNMNARMRRMSYRQQAAHRGKDDPQVAPGEVEPVETDPASEARSCADSRRRRTGPSPTRRPTGRRTTAPAGADQTIAGPVRASDAATKCAVNARMVSAWKTSWKPNQRGERFGRLVPYTIAPAL